MKLTVCWAVFWCVLCGYTVLFLFISGYMSSPFQWPSCDKSPPHPNAHPTYQSSHEPRMVWVGGQGRSGTTLVRAMLDAHPALNCGPETILLANLIGTHKEKLEQLNQLLMEGKDTRKEQQVMQAALRAFIWRVLAERANGAPVLCNKEPHNLRYGHLLHQMFPNSKFVFVIRDGRAVCRSADLPMYALNCILFGGLIQTLLC